MLKMFHRKYYCPVMNTGAPLHTGVRWENIDMNLVSYELRAVKQVNTEGNLKILKGLNKFWRKRIHLRSKSD